jgi:hypothetical protein
LDEGNSTISATKITIRNSGIGIEHDGSMERKGPTQFGGTLDPQRREV